MTFCEYRVLTPVIGADTIWPFLMVTLTFTPPWRLEPEPVYVPSFKAGALGALGAGDVVLVGVVPEGLHADGAGAGTVLVV